VTDRERTPWWLWPNLLSLDAPLVAVAWYWMFTKLWGLRSLPSELWMTLGAVVWAVYAMDRLVDSRSSSPRASLERRHHFHRRFKWIFIVGIILASAWSVYAALAIFSQTVLKYGSFVVFLVICYFVVTFARGKSDSTGLLKNMIAGVTFSYGTACGVHAYIHRFWVSPKCSFPGRWCFLERFVRSI